MTDYQNVRPPVLEPPSGVALSEVLSGLSYALDLTEGQRPGHAARTCLIGMRIADVIGLTGEQRSSLFYALLMKDLGCSSNAARFAALFGADDQGLKAAIKTINWTRAMESYRFVTRNVAPGAFWLTRVWKTLGVLSKGSEGAREVVRTRCERGADIAGMLGFNRDTSLAIRSLDEHWNGLGQPYKLKGQEIPLLGRIASLAQTVEVFATGFDIPTAYDMAATRRGRWFEPELVDALFSFKSDREFWRQLVHDNAMAAVKKVEPAGLVITADEARLDRIAEAFARVVDAKSPWTFQHSQGVAEISGWLGASMGLNATQLRELRRAALLHDLGKLGVSNMILDKPGKLTEAEMASVRRHPRYTLEILERVGCFRDLAPIAAAHHERLDAKGYHRGLGADALPMHARILAVADICDALRSSRPYRTGLPPERILDIMRRDVGTGIDPDCFAALDLILGVAPAPASATPAVEMVAALSEDYSQAA